MRNSVLGFILVLRLKFEDTLNCFKQVQALLLIELFDILFELAPKLINKVFLSLRSLFLLALLSLPMTIVMIIRIIRRIRGILRIGLRRRTVMLLAIVRRPICWILGVLRLMWHKLLLKRILLQVRNITMRILRHGRHSIEWRLCLLHIRIGVGWVRRILSHLHLRWLWRIPILTVVGLWWVTRIGIKSKVARSCLHFFPFIGSWHVWFLLISLRLPLLFQALRIFILLTRRRSVLKFRLHIRLHYLFALAIIDVMRITIKFILNHFQDDFAGAIFLMSIVDRGVAWKRCLDYGGMMKRRALASRSMRLSLAMVMFYWFLLIPIIRELPLLNVSTIKINSSNQAIHRRNSHPYTQILYKHHSIHH